MANNYKFGDDFELDELRASHNLSNVLSNLHKKVKKDFKVKKSLIKK